MKKYRRIEKRGSFEHITTVDESGKYIQIVKWSDGIITSHVENNIFAMGWKSLKEFLSHCKGFEKIA